MEVQSDFAIVIPPNVTSTCPLQVMKVKDLGNVSCLRLPNFMARKTAR